jgi:hypothetical protein
VTRKRSIGVGFSSDVWSSLFFICHMWEYKLYYLNV